MTLLEQILHLPKEEQQDGIRALARRLAEDSDAEDEVAGIELVLTRLVQTAQRRALN
jgi:hypothetical protein